MNQMICGDALTEIRKLPDELVQCVVTSPPYWGLRDYGVDGQLGLEKTPEEYVSKMVEIFREVKRVLKKKGTLWLNLGDTYYNYRGGTDYQSKQTIANHSGHVMNCPSGKRNYKQSNLKGKDLVGIPWRIAFALQADGWYLRSDIIWSKPNPMPESVTDRPTKAHEYIFLLSKNAKYYYDADAIREKAITMKGDKANHSFGVPGGKTEQTPGKKRRESGKKWSPKMGGSGTSFVGHSGNYKENGEPVCGLLRNKRSVWEVPTHPFPEAHFAVYPEELIKPCILAGCPERGIVLDPFMGSGTTALVARNLNRQYIGIELNPEYIKIIEHRLQQQRAAI